MHIDDLPEARGRSLLRTARGLIWALLATTAFSAAQAGPPYLTDDPEPTDTGKWEIYLFGQGEHFKHAFTGEGGLDINYGLAPDLQLTVELPVEVEHGHNWNIGVTDPGLGMKYKFIHQSEGGIVPDVSFYPTLSLPFGEKRFSTNKVGVALPFYAQKDFGKWSLFGGGGYTINPGAGERDFWSVSYAVERQMTERLSLGADLYHQSVEEVGGRPSTKVEVGGGYEFAKNWSLLFATHAEIQHAHANGAYGFYVGLAFEN